LPSLCESEERRSLSSSLEPSGLLKNNKHINTLRYTLRLPFYVFILGSRDKERLRLSSLSQREGKAKQSSALSLLLILQMLNGWWYQWQTIYMFIIYIVNEWLFPNTSYK
jgi:hypothetical protein